jgi:DNA mismatch repair protein MutS2
LKKAKQPLDAIKTIEENIEQIEEKIEAPVERRLTVERGRSSITNRPLSLGERITVSTLNTEGVITALGESDAEVQIGSLRVRARLTDLARKSGEQSPSSNRTEDDRPKTIVNRPPSTISSPGIELNLRGKLVEDGLEELDRYLERAYSSGLLFVRIVHGKGTGRLREAVRNALRSSPYVASFEEPKDNEGGAGVTVARMAK